MGHLRKRQAKTVVVDAPWADANGGQVRIAGKEGYAVLEEIGREFSAMSCFSTGQTLNPSQGERNCVLSGQQQGKHFDNVSPEGLRDRLGGSYAFIL